MSRHRTGDPDPAASERAFLEWIAADVRTRMRRNLPAGEREAALRHFQAALGEVLCRAPLPVGTRGRDAVAEIAGRARIAATFGATYGDEAAG